MKQKVSENMKNAGCLTRIQTVYKRLSLVSQKVADFVQENPQKVIYMTVLQTAEACEVSEASVVRFCKSLQYSGCNEMKINLAAESDSGGRIIMDDVVPTDDDETILQKVFSSEIHALETTLQGVGKENFAQAVARIAFSNKIEFFSCGNTRSVAQDAGYRFLRVGVDVRMAWTKWIP